MNIENVRTYPNSHVIENLHMLHIIQNLGILHIIQRRVIAEYVCLRTKYCTEIHISTKYYN